MRAPIATVRRLLALRRRARAAPLLPVNPVPADLVHLVGAAREVC